MAFMGAFGGDKESNFIEGCLMKMEEELNELEKIEKASTTLQELLQKIGNSSDPLLPVSRGPANPSWDRWFEGPQELHGCKCWAL